MTKKNSNQPEGHRNGHNGHRRPQKKKQQSRPKFHELLKRGTHALQLGRVTEATTLLEQAHELNKDNGDIILNLGGAYILSKKFKEAIALLEPLSEREPDNPMVWTNLGAAYLGNPILATKERQHRAIGAFKLAIALNPKAPNVAYNLGLIYRDRREIDQAIYWFRRALDANPEDRDARYYIKKLTQEDKNKGDGQHTDNEAT